MADEKEQSYLPVNVYEPGKVLDFLREHFGFEDRSLIDKGAIEGSRLMTADRFGNSFQLLTRLVTAEPVDMVETVLIVTPNLLKDVHQLRASGVKIEQEPKYSSQGLEIIFSDDNGNRYRLLEKRDYTDK